MFRGFLLWLGIPPRSRGCRTRLRFNPLTIILLPVCFIYWAIELCVTFIIYNTFSILCKVEHFVLDILSYNASENSEFMVELLKAELYRLLGRNVTWKLDATVALRVVQNHPEFVTLIPNPTSELVEYALLKRWQLLRLFPDVDEVLLREIISTAPCAVYLVRRPSHAIMKFAIESGLNV